MFRFQLKISPTTFLVAANIAVYIFTSVIGGNIFETNINILQIFGQYNYSVMNGAYWQLLTSIFVHVDIIHITLNMLFLFIFGLRAEEFFKTEEYFAVYMLSGLTGSLLTLFFMSANTVSAGASGAVFGMFGAGLIYMRKRFGQSIVGALLFSLLFLMLSTGSGVNVIAHFGGLATGLIIGYVLAQSRQEKYWIENY
ncbi:MAG: rhomboid family intramembrane serine protease [Candidatus Bathyarchaeota archaeon]|nr:rhomboid family intramembrane serine protease [Candidatus Bathyarchaeum tardum]WGM89152.1 MAG: rhomboid family intramembrane serine protease [Candidatus Bathyarchaeum tardum]WNZ28610.1 MAG: rhomboid family intramembrane serine protease [Candidatus Bathyarchaeota archaeon]